MARVDRVADSLAFAVHPSAPAMVDDFDPRKVTAPVLLHLLGKELRRIADGAEECRFVWELKE